MTTQSPLEQAHAEIAFLSRKILDLNKQLIESQKAKTNFLSLVSNELNNPMTALLGLVPHLEPAIENESKKAIFEMVLDELFGMDFRIQNMVATARIESGECSVAYNQVRLTEVMSDVQKMLKYHLASKNCTLEIEDRIQEAIQTDAHKIYMILKNLVANAVTYGYPDRPILVHFEIQDRTVVLAVKNFGTPPDVDYPAQLFTRFAKNTQGVHGLGLGLSIVRSLCEFLEGRVDYRYEEPYVIFEARLPLGNMDVSANACGGNEFFFDVSDGDTIEL